MANSAKPLALSRQEQFILAAYDILLIVMPVLQIIKTDRASSLSRHPVSLNSQLVTLFTIVFVTIIPTFVKRYALWKAQRGAYLSDLEQLQSSVSLPSTFKLIWSLRSFSRTSVLLVLVWSFYYLGSQAVKEEYQLSNSDTFRNYYAVVQRPDAITIFSPTANDLLNTTGYSENVTSNDVRDLNYRFASAILDKAGIDASVDEDPEPGMNNGPLMPDLSMLRSIAGTDPTKELDYHRHGWIDVSKQSNNVDAYTNYQGVAAYITAWSTKDNNTSYNTQQVLGSYTLDTSYLSVGCGDYEVFPIEAFRNSTTYNSSISLNLTSFRTDAPRDTEGHSLREFEYWWRGYVVVNLTVEHLPDGGFNVLNGTNALYAVKSVCNITSKHVDLQVSCTTAGCTPHRMRWKKNKGEAAATNFSTPFDSREFGDTFLSNTLLSTGPVYDYQNTDTLVLNLIQPNSQGTINSLSEGQSLGTPHSLRLTQLSNTYLTLAQSAMAQKLPFGLNIPAIMEHGSNPIFNRVIVDGAPFLRQYRVYWQWIPIDFLAGAILLAAAIGSWWLRVNTLAPDIFGYVLSLTRDNDNIPLPTECSMLSGTIYRARVLKHVKVKTTCRERRVGRVVLGGLVLRLPVRVCRACNVSDCTSRGRLLIMLNDMMG